MEVGTCLSGKYVQGFQLPGLLATESLRLLPCVRWTRHRGSSQRLLLRELGSQIFPAMDAMERSGLVNQLPHDLRSSYKRSCQHFLSEARTLSPEDRQGHEKESIQRQQRLIAAGMDSFLPVPNGLDRRRPLEQGVDLAPSPLGARSRGRDENNVLAFDRRHYSLFLGLFFYR